jgi:hypothetical protein
VTPDALFGVCNLVAVAGWLALIVALWTRRPASLAATFGGTVIPLTLALVYLALIASHIAGAPGGFSTLQAVADLFSNRWLLLAGWVHYLAFDLFIGSWEARDAARHGIPHLLVIPCLALTFLFGPVGLLLYFALRTWRAGVISIA